MGSCHYSITPLLHHSVGEIIVAPSILAANFSNLADEVDRVEQAGANWIHCDIMDGHFVDNISFGPAIVDFVRKLTTLPLDVHLMIEHADHYVPRFVEAGANSITVHVEPEAKHDVAKTLRQIRENGCRAGLSLNPATPFESVDPFLDKIDILLVMTVHPGFGGQSFRAEQMEKVRRAAEWKKWRQRPRRRHFHLSHARLRRGDSRTARLWVAHASRVVDCTAQLATTGSAS